METGAFVVVLLIKYCKHEKNFGCILVPFKPIDQIIKVTEFYFSAPKQKTIVNQANNVYT